MLAFPCCCDGILPSSSSSSSSVDPPPPEIEDNCSRGNCSGEVIPRNFSVNWNWQPTIHAGEITLSNPPLGDGYWHILTYGSVCTSRYKTGGWLLKYVEPPDPFPSILGCRWESDERLPLLSYTAFTDSDPYDNTGGYPMFCADVLNIPIASLTIGDGSFGDRGTFRLIIQSPETQSETYGRTALIYEGRTLAEDGKTDCLASTTLHLVTPTSGTRLTNYSVSGVLFEDGGTANIPAFIAYGAYYDGGYTFDPNNRDPDDPRFGYFYNFPPLPTTCSISPA